MFTKSVRKQMEEQGFNQIGDPKGQGLEESLRLIQEDDGLRLNPVHKICDYYLRIVEGDHGASINPRYILYQRSAQLGGL